MKTILGVLLMILGFLGGIVAAIVLLVTGVINIYTMVDTHTVNFWGLFWAIIMIITREAVAGVIIWSSWIFGIMLIKGK